MMDSPDTHSPNVDRGREPQRPSIVSSTLLTFGTQLGIAALSLVNVLIVARALGPDGRGQIAFLTTLSYLTSQIALLGVEQANVNLAGAEPETRSALAGNSLVLAFVFGLVAAAAVAAVILFFPNVGEQIDPRLRWLALGTIPVLILQTYLLLLMRADYRFVYTSAASLIVPVINVGVNASLSILGLLTVGRAFGTWVAGQVLATVILAWWLHGRLAGFGRPDAALARRAIGFGVKAHIGRVMMLGNYKLDQLLVGIMAGSRELGLYSVAVAWAEALFYLPTAVAAVQRPDLVRTSKKEAADQSVVAFRAVLLVTVALAAGLIVAAPFLCVVAFGAAFRGSIDDLRVLALGAFGIVALKLLGSALTAQRRPLLETAAISIAFTVTVVLDVLLIPDYGGLGAAVASAVAYIGGGVAVVVLFGRGLGVRLARLVPRPSDGFIVLHGLKGVTRASSDRHSTSSNPSLQSGLPHKDSHLDSV